MKKQGLKPHHYFLDVGCGSLRGGVHFIDYLEPGHYFGYDLREDLIESAKIELEKNNLTKKKPVLEVVEDFDARDFNQKFDYALAFSVFTHLGLNRIIMGLVQTGRVLKKDGKFFATFFESKDEIFELGTIEQYKGENGVVVSRPDQDPYHYHINTLEWISKNAGLTIDRVSDFPHPRNQKMFEFKRR